MAGAVSQSQTSRCRRASRSHCRVREVFGVGQDGAFEGKLDHAQFGVVREVEDAGGPVEVIGVEQPVLGRRVAEPVVQLDCFLGGVQGRINRPASAGEGNRS